MRTAAFASLLILAASSAVFADSRPETTTYIDGNLTGVSPNSGGTLMFTDDKAMYLHTGLETVAIPYAGITNAELGAVKETSHDVPLYKVWALHKRFSKTQTQFLIVKFKNDDGEDKNMTLELATSAASSVLSDLQTRSGKTFVAEQKAEPAKSEVASSKKATKSAPAASTPASADEWWGDSIWKTSRNADRWGKPAGTIAPDQQQ